MAQRADHISLSIQDEPANHISSRIQNELACFSPPPSERCIFRVHDKLRTHNEKAYEPSIIAIGPYYHGKGKLQEMEEHKLWYLQQLLQRKNETIVDKYVMAMSDMEERARKCYAESSSLDKTDFVKMMLLDGVFVIEFFRKCNSKSNYEDDPLFQFWAIQGQVFCDLLLLENQLPFFILVQLLNMTRDPNTEEDIISLALSSLEVVPGPDIPVDDVKHLFHLVDDVKHLLHLVHRSMCPSFANENENDQDKGKDEDSMYLSFAKKQMKGSTAKKKMKGSMCLPFAKKSKSYGEENENDQDKGKDEDKNKGKDKDEDEDVFTYTATELQEFGIEFKVAKESNSLFNIKFANGSMEIPRLVIDDWTESILRNLIAYEQFTPGGQQKYVSDYANFMDFLVNSPKDAALLRCSRIIVNLSGDDIAVCNMFNKLSNDVMLSPKPYHNQVFTDVRKYCRRPSNKWMANLRHNYFNSPWASISVVAAVVLLLLTVAQTIFSALSYI
ncbi:unnamed protein product [Ilex paraguariensis]|uniref:Uncharacterized protein n=1 Tax=Ilex paraguariensis TaxID=185542 RepID=A0ABC8UWH6_9AQUA